MPIDDYKGLAEYTAAARKAGYSDEEIESYLQTRPDLVPPSRTVAGTAGDVGIAAAKGFMGLTEAAVGLADIPTGGRVGKFMDEAVGFRPNDAREVMDSYLSPAQQEANRRVDIAGEGKDLLGKFVDKSAAAVQNPSVIGSAVVESLPLMVGGARLGQGVVKGAAALTGRQGIKSAAAKGLAGAVIGEGALGAGSAAEQIRQQTEDGTLSGSQVLSAIGSGLGTSAFTLIGGKVASKLGIADIDSLIASGNVTAEVAKKGFLRQLVEGGFSEGVLEELPQSVQEQLWQNYATDRPLSEGVPEAASLGMLSGAVMGGPTAGLLSKRATVQAQGGDALDQAAAGAGSLSYGQRRAPVATDSRPWNPAAAPEVTQPEALTPEVMPPRQGLLSAANPLLQLPAPDNTTPIPLGGTIPMRSPNSVDLRSRTDERQTGQEPPDRRALEKRKENMEKMGVLSEKASPKRKEEYQAIVAQIERIDQGENADGMPVLQENRSETQETLPVLWGEGADQQERRTAEVAGTLPEQGMAPQGDLKKLPANSIVTQINDLNGKPMGYEVTPHDGTPEGMTKAAQANARKMNNYPNASMNETQHLVTNADGTPTNEINARFGDLKPLPQADAVPTPPSTPPLATGGVIESTPTNKEPLTVAEKPKGDGVILEGKSISRADLRQHISGRFGIDASVTEGPDGTTRIGAQSIQSLKTLQTAFRSDNDFIAAGSEDGLAIHVRPNPGVGRRSMKIGLPSDLPSVGTDTAGVTAPTSIKPTTPFASPANNGLKNTPAHTETVEVTGHKRDRLTAMRDEISQGEAGKRMPVTADMREWTGIASTFPDYFKDKGLTKKETLAIIDRALAPGAKLTPKQAATIKDLTTGRNAIALDQLLKKRKDRQAQRRAEADFFMVDESAKADNIELAKELYANLSDEEAVALLNSDIFGQDTAEAIESLENDYADTESFAGQTEESAGSGSERSAEPSGEMPRQEVAVEKIATGELQENFASAKTAPSFTRKSGTKGDGVTSLDFNLEAGLFDELGNGVKAEREKTPYEIESEKNDARVDEYRRLVAAGNKAVPGIRIAQAEEAGRVWEMYQAGGMTETQWDEYVADLGETGRITDYVKKEKKATPAAAPVARQAEAPVSSQKPSTGRYEQPNKSFVATAAGQSNLSNRAGRISTLIMLNESQGSPYTRNEIEQTADDRIDAVQDWLIKRQMSPEVSPQEAKKEGKKEETGLSDFGQKLGGARKDKQPSLAKEYSDAELSSLPLSKIWPKEEIDAIEDTFMAAVATAGRAEIPSKPRQDYKVKNWINKIKAIRGMVNSVANGEANLGVDVYRKRLSEWKALEGFYAKVELLEQLPREQWKRIGKVAEHPDAYSYNGKDSEGNYIKVPSPHSTVEIDGKFYRFNTGTVAESYESINEKLSGEVAGKKMKFEVRGRGDRWFINKDGDPLYRPLKVFTDSKEAVSFARDSGNYSLLVQEWENIKERENVKESDTRREENRPRVGADHRKGKDVTPEMFTKDLGFRGVEFGNWVNQGKADKDRQGMLNAAYDALMDMASILNIPPKAVSLNGTLGLGFGSRGSGKASAHYEPDTLVINLTKTRGAGSLGHEFFHALDRYFQMQRENVVGNRSDMYITHNPENYYRDASRGFTLSESRFNEMKAQGRIRNADTWTKVEGVRPEVAEAFNELVKALNASPMFKRASLIDKGKSDGYWSRTLERAARSFENYLIAKMQQKGYHNDYLANVTTIEEFGRDAGRYPYLLADEIPPVAEAFDNLFATIQTKETEQGTAIFSVPKSSAKGTALPLITGIAKRVKLADGWNVKAVKTTAELPAEVQAEMKRQGITQVEGVKNSNDKTIYLVADGLSSMNRAKQVVAHEMFHVGIIEAELRSYLKSLSRGKLDAFKRQNPAYAKADDLTIANEMLAQEAETNLWIKRIIGKVNDWLKSIGIDLKISKADVYSMIDRAMTNATKEESQTEGVNFLAQKLVPFFSQFAKVIDAKMGGRMKVEELRAMLKSNQVTDDEITQLIGGLDGVVTKAQVLDEIAANSVEFEDVVLGEMGASEDERNRVSRREFGEDYDDIEESDQEWVDGQLGDRGIAVDTHFSQYTEPGFVPGSYREMFVTAPNTGTKRTVEDAKKYFGITDSDWSGMTADQHKSYLSEMLDYKDGQGGWQDGHSQYSDIQNPIVRIRFNTREVDGKIYLFVEEMQGPSDANQQKMPAYLVKRIYDIGVKRVLAYAKENGASSAFIEATKPYSGREIIENFSQGQESLQSLLSVMDAPMISMLNHKQVRQAIIALLPIKVMDALAENKFSADQLVRNPAMVLKSLSIDSRSYVATEFVLSLRKVGTSLGTALYKTLSQETAGGKKELLPALDASMLNPREVAGLLTTSRRYHVGNLDSGVGLGGAASAAIPGFQTGEGGELTPARLADLLNRHDQILTGSPSNVNKKYEDGITGISWTTGTMQANRYDLSKQVDEIFYRKLKNGKIEIDAAKDGNKAISHKVDSAAELEGVVGKEIAKKIVDNVGMVSAEDGKVWGRLTNLDLKVGGEGLKTLYDRTLPSLFKKYGKESVGEIQLKAETEGYRIEAYEDPQVLDSTSKRYQVVNANGKVLADGFKRHIDAVLAQSSLREKDSFSVPFIAISDKTPSTFPQFSALGRTLKNMADDLKGNPFAKDVQPIELSGGFNENGRDNPRLQQGAKRGHAERQLFEAISYGNTAVKLGEAAHEVARRIKDGSLDKAAALQAFAQEVNKTAITTPDGMFILRDIRNHLKELGHDIPNSGKEAMAGLFRGIGDAWQKSQGIQFSAKSGVMTLYHGSTSNVPMTPDGNGNVHFFATKEQATLYGDVSTVDVNINNPKIINAGGKLKGEWGNYDDEISDAKADGHDALIVKNIIDVPSDMEEGSYRSELEDYAGDVVIPFNLKNINFSVPKYTVKGNMQDVPSKGVFESGKDYIDRLVEESPKFKDNIERFVYAWLNTNDPRKRVYAAADRKTVRNNMVTVEELRGKKTAAEVAAFRESTVEPMLKELAEAKLAVSDLEEYGHALHAPERNQRMREVNAKRILDQLTHRMTDGEAEVWQEKIDALHGDKSLTDKETQQGYLDLMDEIFADIDKREREVERRQEILDNRKWTQDEIDKGTPERAQKLVDNAVRNIEATRALEEKWLDESPRYSGMTDEEADSIVDKWEKDPRRKALKSAKAKLDAINRAGLDALHESGELSDTEYDGILNGYQHYVPLMRGGFTDARPTTGRITGPTGKPLKVAMGSMREVVNIVAHSVQNYQTAVNRKHKAAAGKALFEFALDNPNSGITVEKVAKKPTHDKEGNIVLYPDMMEPDNGVFVKVDGERHLLLFDTDERTAKGRTLARFLDSIKGDSMQLGPLMNALTKVNRYLAMVNTMLSPEFMLSNFVRDFQTSMIHLSDEKIRPDKGFRKKVSKDIFPAIAGIYRSEAGKDGGEMGKWYKEFAKEGGKIGWLQGYEKIDDLAKELEHSMKLYGEGHVTLKSLEAMKKLVSQSNTSVENGVRLATYKNLVESGVSKQKSASIASKLTVDFTQKGKYGPALNSLYLFANAGIQGNVRMITALGTSKKVQKIVGGLMMGGFALQLMALAGGDDDTGEPYVLGLPDFVRERNIIFMIPGTEGKYISVPMPYGYNVFNNIGAEAANLLYMGTQGKDYDASQGAMRIATTFANSFNPLSSGTILQTLSPTIADPIVMAAENKDYTGRSLMPEQSQFDAPKPDSEMYWKGVSPTSKYVAAIVNNLTGGDRYESGLVDVSPETLDMIYDTATGSTGKFVANILNLPQRVMSGEMEPNRMPFSRRFFGQWDDKAISERYYAAVEKGEIAKQRLDGAETEGEKERVRNSAEFQNFRLSKGYEKQIAFLRKNLKFAEAKNDKERVDRIRKQITDAQKKYLSTVNRLQSTEN